MSGYIKLHRAVRGTAIAQHPEYFAAWVHLLCMATHKTHDQIVGTKIVTLNPGDLVFGRQKFSATTGISENKVRSALKVMKDLGMITSKSHAKYSVITIVNWAKYQTESPANNQKTTSKPPANHHKQEGSNKGKEGSKKDIGANALDYSDWPDMPSDQVFADWLQMRKRKKANVTQTVINRFAKQLKIAKDRGFSVDDCLSECLVRNWTGFEADWMKGGGKSFDPTDNSPTDSQMEELKRTLREYS